MLGMAAAEFWQEFVLIGLGALTSAPVYVTLKANIRGAQRQQILDEVLPPVEEALKLPEDPSVETQVLDVDAHGLLVRAKRLQQSTERLTILEHRQAKQLVDAARRYGEVRTRIDDEKWTQMRRINGAAYRVRSSLSARFHLIPYRLLRSLTIRMHIRRDPTME